MVERVLQTELVTFPEESVFLLRQLNEALLTENQ